MIPYESFHMFAFIDETWFCTTTPGISTRRRYDFHDNVQRLFYLSYCSGYGIEVQAVTLPNGMFGSVYVGAWMVSDAVLPEYERFRYPFESFIQ